MGSKDLIVLAECVDKRSGKRFAVGDTFDPVPGVEQAKRLIIAGCLPQGAYKLAMNAEEDEEDRQFDIVMAAKTAVEDAEKAVNEAQSKLAAAADAEKPDAQKALDEAKAVQKAAQAALKKLGK